MGELTIGQLAKVVHGRLRFGTMPPLGGEWEPVRRVVTRSSDVASGDVAILTEAERRRGSCLEEAFARGALGAIVVGDRDEPWAGKATIEVASMEQALTGLAGWAQTQFTGHWIGIAGDVGATTAARLTHRVLQKTQRGVLVSLAPETDGIEPWLSLLQSPSADYGIVVLSTQQIAAVNRFAPSLRFRGLVLTGWQDPLPSAADHTARVDLLEKHVGQGAEDSWVVCNGDDAELHGMARRLADEVQFIGRSSRCDLLATHIRQEAGRLTFQANGHPLELPWGVRQQVVPALAAYAVGRRYGVPSAAIRTALQQTASGGGVLAPQRTQRGATLLRNVHHGALADALAGLETLRDYPGTGRRIVVTFGLSPSEDPQSARRHRFLGDAVVTRCGADLLMITGKYSSELAAGALRAGMPAQRIHVGTHPESLLEAVEPQLNEDDIVLVSGKESPEVDWIIQQLGATRLSAAA